MSLPSPEPPAPPADTDAPEYIRLAEQIGVVLSGASVEEGLKALCCASVEVARACGYDMERFPDDYAETIARYVDHNPTPAIRLTVQNPT